MPTANTVRRYFKPLVFLACWWPVYWLTWHAFGIHRSSLGANPVETLQDTCGDWGLRFLLITLAVTPLKDWTGWTWLILLRRMLGLFGFFYVLAHFLVWLILDQDLYWPGLLPEIIKRPFITVGLIALMLLIPLAITSTNKMMRRLGKRWKPLHRLIYPICILGCWHYYWQVKADVREPLVYFGITAVLLGWRLYKHYRSKRSSREIAEIPGDRTGISATVNSREP